MKVILIGAMLLVLRYLSYVVHVLIITKKVFLLAVVMVHSQNAVSAFVEYQLAFEQTYFHPIGARYIGASFLIDDALIGSGNENKQYTSNSSNSFPFVGFTAEIGSTPIQDFVTGTGTYIYDYEKTSLPQVHGFSFVIETDSAGEISRVSGRLKKPNTVNELTLGRDGEEGEYIDAMQVAIGTGVVVSRGTYSWYRVNADPVPIPAAAWLFGSALAGLSVFRRKRS